MSSTVKQIIMDKPCSQNWADMHSIANGKYCLSCKKTVVDFTKLSDDMIINYFSGADSLCCKINDYQLVNINNQLAAQRKTHFSWKKVSIAAIILTITPALKSAAQSITTTQQSPSKRMPTVSNNVLFRTVTGVVRSENNRLPVPGVRIQAAGSNNYAFSKPDGSYMINIPEKTDSLEFYFIGFDKQMISIEFRDQKDFNVILRNHQISDDASKQYSTMLGGAQAIGMSIGVYKPTFWYKLKHIFLKRQH